MFTLLRCRKCKNNAGTFDVFLDILNIQQLLVRMLVLACMFTLFVRL